MLAMQLLRETGEKMAAELEAAGSTCCWMTGTSVPASNSKMPTWSGFHTVSMLARSGERPGGAGDARHGSSVDVALDEVVAQVKRACRKRALLEARSQRRLTVPEVTALGS